MQKQFIEFIKLTVTTIQTDHQGSKTAREAMISLLEEADRKHIELTGQPIVKRGMKSVLEVIAGGNPLSKIS